MSGELKKMKIKATDNAGKPLEYIALVNPETYSIKHKINYNPENPPPGNPGKEQQYANTASPDIQFDFIFDSTGVIPRPLEGLAGALSGVPIAGAIAGALSPPPAYNILEEIEAFKNIVLEYDGDIHEPRTVKLLWGVLYFEGRLTNLQFNYKLFSPDGVPVRVVASASFVQTVEHTLLEALKENKSPDVTHIRIVGEGDTLPLMAYRIYGDAAYYLEVARVNRLVNFRNLKPGDEILFPPIQKSV